MKVTIVLILINTLVFVFTAPELNYFIENYGFQTTVFVRGEYYRIITSLFLHANLLHLGFNMLSLFLLGTSLEKKIDPFRFLLVYFVGGMIGNLGMFLPFFPPDTIGVGASGAISALVGLGTFLCPGKLVIFPSILPLPFVVAGAIFFLITAMNLFTPQTEIGYQVHMIGLIVGMIFGMIWGRNWLRGILIFILVLVLIIALSFVLNMYF
jgi:membrane associated rhomboid family serine protease